MGGHRGREFAEQEILPYVEQYEREERYPLELIAKLPPLGLMGPMIPEEYGGSFSDVVTYGLICEELARLREKYLFIQPFP